MRVRCFIVGIGSLLIFTAIAAAGQVEDPFFKTWASCKPGTTITLRDLRKDATGEHKTEIKYTLDSVAADSVEVTVQTTSEGTGKTQTFPARKTTITRMTEETEDSAAGFKELEKAPTESVTVPAGTFKAKVWMHVIDNDPVMTLKSKLWISYDVPGGNVKTEMYTGKAGEEKLASTIELVAMEKK